MNNIAVNSTYAPESRILVAATTTCRQISGDCFGLMNIFLDGTLSNANHSVPEHVQFQLQRLNEAAVIGEFIFAVIQTIANTAY